MMDADNPFLPESLAKRVSLNPGDFRFFPPINGTPTVRLHTLLGSCVSVIMWHPQCRIGGMSHAVLALRAGQNSGKALQGRYCADAVALFRQEIARVNTSAKQYQVYLVGGGTMYRPLDSECSVGDRNVEVTRSCLLKSGFTILAEHVGGDYHRNVELDLNTGIVTVTANRKQIILSSR